MLEQFSRTQLILGQEAVEKLNNSRVIVFGIGGVGGFVVEALVRSGIGAIDIVDNDDVCLSNINRQIIATHDTVGKVKVDAMEKRILSINPQCKITKHKCFFLPETKEQFDFTQYDYIVDAVDTVTAKIALVMAAKEANVPIISSMGAGNKINPTMFEVADIYKTSVCPLAKVMRKELKKRGVEKLKVVYSKEKALTPKVEKNSSDVEKEDVNDDSKRRAVPGSVSFVPPVVGYIIASEIIKDITGIRNDA
ncbi:tRNA A37 threonylcarbamoyladenosine dehydratase [Lachnospiraceae bacterium C7]|nr:tRNA A37 threonylcarbamoyladenosine dehydratase [Lachnospiraceae bacterium C7]